MKRVLIVDDEKSSADIISYFIREYNLPLEILGIAARGDVALKEINKLKPDIVFLDIEMPGMNGLEVIEAARKSCYSNTVYIVITAFNKFDYAQKALRLGAKDLLLKPVQYGQFSETMQRVIGYQYSSNPLFNQLLEYIHEHYTQDIELADCAGALSTSANNISRMFKKHLDTNFTAYYNKLRIDKALELLAQGDAIKDVAHTVGYHNLNYFYRKFKDQVGLTPREYVDNNQSGQV